jgi:hypothetical protein
MKWSLLLLLFLLSACSRHDQVASRSFYFWRTVFSLSESEQRELMQTGVHRLYVRFFDVDFDAARQQTKPVQDIRFATAVDSLLEVVPVVFLTNRSLVQNPDSSIQDLGVRIAERVKEIAHAMPGQHLREVQLDCDWTETTREKYFKLIEQIKAEFRPIQISATIRLHQIKYFRRTGVPPVDRGMLMFYNMGKLEEVNTTNSIYDEHTAEAYLNGLSNYPLPLDIALPCFSWLVVLQNGHLAALINDPDERELAAAPDIAGIDKNRFVVKRRTRFENTDLFEGENLRLEQVDAGLSEQAAKQIASKLKGIPRHIAIYHLNKNQYTAHEKQGFEAVFNRFD